MAGARSLRPAGTVAGADAGGERDQAGAGLRQGAVHRRDGRGGAGRAADRRGEGARRHGGGHGAVPGRGLTERVLHRRGRGAAAGYV